MCELNFLKASLIQWKIAKEDPKLWGEGLRCESYVAHVLEVFTDNVRGKATLYAELIQAGVSIYMSFVVYISAAHTSFSSSLGSMMGGRIFSCLSILQEKLIQSCGSECWDEFLEMGYLTHSAYDCPKKHKSEAVLAVARQVCHRAGVWSHCDRAPWNSCMDVLLAPFLKPTAKLWRYPWEAMGLQNKLPDGIQLGQVWVPAPRIVLGEGAGRWCRHLLHMHEARTFWRKSAQTNPLVEIFLALKHKLSRRDGAEEALFEFDAKLLQDILATCRSGRGLETLSALSFSHLF